MVTFICLLYDKYTPQVEAQILKDFIALTTSVAGQDDQYVVISDRIDAEKVLSSLGVQLITFETASESDIKSVSIVLRYKVGDYFTDIPDVVYENAKYEIVDRDLKVRTVNQPMDLDVKPNPTLKEQGRPYVSPIDRLRSVRPNGPIFPDPAVIFLWGP